MAVDDLLSGFPTVAQLQALLNSKDAELSTFRKELQDAEQAAKIPSFPIPHPHLQTVI